MLVYRQTKGFLLRSTFIGERLLSVSLLSGCCAISGFGRHLGLADHSPRFHARALNPAGLVKSRGLTRFGLDAMQFSGFGRHLRLADHSPRFRTQFMNPRLLLVKLLSWQWLRTLRWHTDMWDVGGLILTVRLCCMRHVDDKVATGIISCKTNLQLVVHET